MNRGRRAGRASGQTKPAWAGGASARPAQPNGRGAPPGERLTGTLTWYNRQRGFGFVTPDGGQKDVFVHHTALPAGVGEGDRVAFRVEQGRKGSAAVEVSALAQAPAPARQAAPVPAAPPAPSAALTDARFADLHLDPELLRAVAAEGYAAPTPIQVQAIPHVLRGADVLGCAQTGTGKTAAFALPILQRLAAAPEGPRRANGKRRPVRVLVLAPTRELAIQIADSFTAYGRFSGLSSAVIYGGVGQNPQVRALQQGVDILVATPGRLLDLIGQQHVALGSVEVLVLDEADRMLDMGFIHDVQRIVKLTPSARQTLLFSATLPREITALADDILRDPVSIYVAPEQPTLEAIEQAVYFVPAKQKQALLEYVLADRSVTRALVFTRTKHGANKVVKNLARAGVPAEPIHGNKSQSARQNALQHFRDGSTRVLVATDVLARGIDVDHISHVIQFDLPNEPDTYVHRIGRTARAGAIGTALAFCAEEERPFLQEIEKLIHMRVPRVEDHPHAV